MESAVLSKVIVPGGDLVLIMTSDEVWHRQYLAKKQPQSHFQCRISSIEGISARNETASPRGGDIRIQVDSALLMRISKPFRVFLDPNAVEGRRLVETGQVCGKSIHNPQTSFTSLSVYSEEDSATFSAWPCC